MCNETERSECHSYIRQRIKTIPSEQIESIEQESNLPAVKRFKGDLFSRYESNTFDNDAELGGESGNESEEYPVVSKKTDELDRYLTLDLEKSKIDPNPLLFWNEHKQKYPRLSRLARSIFSIPATSAGVEREFSSAGMVINERRTNLNPEHVDNILLVRSMKKNKLE